MDSDDEYFYYSDDDVEEQSNGDGGSSAVVSASGGDAVQFNGRNGLEYSVLNEEDLRANQDTIIKEVSDVLSTSFDRASVLLLHYQWNKEKLFDKYYQDPERTCQEAGAVQGVVDTLNPNNQESKGEMFLCGILFEEVPLSQTFCMGCSTEEHPEPHRFSVGAWQDYLSCKVDDGPDSIFARCPMDGCQCVVSPSIWKQILTFPADDEDEAKAYRAALEKYNQFLFDSYVNINRNMKWCPSPGCSTAIAASGAVTEVQCTTCTLKFCFKCGREAHAPIRCPELAQWLEKCNNESETANWILANTKKCPQCSTRIEKNQGCNHMVCGVCKNEFCWVCMGSWKDHGTSTGGYYNCNKYTEDDKDQGTDQKSKAKRELDRYLHYYQRFATHAQAGNFATNQREKAERKMIDMQTNGNVGWIDVQYLEQAVEQLIECRRVLKYTYAFAYYLPSGPKKDLFEYNQSMLESHTEHLSELSESGSADVDRSEVINYTRVTGKFMKSLLEQVDHDGLGEADAVK